MADPISSVAGAHLASTPSPAGARRADGAAFVETLSKLVDHVETSSTAANAAVGNMLAGTGDVHEAMIALQQAETALELTVQVRNKLVQAYQEIMRMPV